MEEKLISFETAKLAKKKGFNIPSHSYYFEDKEFKEFEINDTYGYYGDEYTVNRDEFYEDWNSKWRTTKEGNRCLGCNSNPKYLETFSAPTQSLLQKWLRETYKIIVIIELRDKYEVKIHWVDITSGNYNVDRGDTYTTYEQALEEGLYEALKLI